ncbi:MAG: permease [Candidatus Gracilibacteria bacterium]|jgi:uncharacterized membrane protein YraQ (UPF0718 family)|nr:permease [Candidatus Gracilibacteria bacterium]
MFFKIAQYISFELLNLDPESKWAHMSLFFFEDSLKIIALILIMTHIMSLFRYYLNITKIRNFLQKRNLYGLDYFIASFFGAITPFCSCSSLPLFIGFVQSGIPLGIAFSFLITSPLINEVAIGVFLGAFGLKMTMVYVGFGILIGVFGGFILGKMNLENHIEPFVKGQDFTEKTNEPFQNILKKTSKEARGISKKIIPYILLGVGLGAFIHGFVPDGYFENILNRAGIWGVPISVILAVPLYSNASGTIPIIQSLVTKGVPLGTAIAFMMAIVGISLPEAIILKKVMKIKLLAIFFGIVTIGIIIIGYLLNWLF